MARLARIYRAMCVVRRLSQAIEVDEARVFTDESAMLRARIATRRRRLRRLAAAVTAGLSS